jgi:hypothetical protein
MSLMDEKDNASLERGAANDIVRLRWRLKIRENIIGRLVAENQRHGATCPHVRGTVTQHCSLNFTLTDEEREAIAWCVELLDELGSSKGDTMRHLLERLT